MGWASNNGFDDECFLRLDDDDDDDCWLLDDGEEEEEELGWRSRCLVSGWSFA